MHDEFLQPGVLHICNLLSAENAVYLLKIATVRLLGVSRI